MASTMRAVRRYDAEIGIVGAGPAGARAAEFLATMGVEVLLSDPRAPWEKPSGGGLTAAVLRHVPELAGITPAARRIDCVRLETTGGAVEVPLEESLYVISRATLSRWQLARARRAGAEFLGESMHHLERRSDGWSVRSGSGAERRVRCLTGADGAASRVRAAVSPIMRVELAPTRVAFVPGPGPSATRIHIQFTPGEADYGWDCARPEHRSVGVVREPGRCSRAELDAEVDHLRTAVDGHGEASVARAGAVIATARCPRRLGYSEIGASAFALLGDAVGLADPATGEGIHNALSSGCTGGGGLRRQSYIRAHPERAAARFEPEFRTARLLRRLLYGHDAAVRLIQAAARHTSAYALLTALMDGANAHDGSARAVVARLLGRGITPRAESLPRQLYQALRPAR